MRRGTLLPDTAEVELGFLRPKDGTIQMHLRACRVSAVCPQCQMISSRVHSRYARELGDLPWEGIPVRIYLQTRKVLLRREGLPAAHLHRATAQHGPAICAEDPALLRSSGLDHAGFRWRGGIAPGTPYGAAGRWLHAAAATTAEIKRRDSAGSACSRHRRLGLAQGPPLRHHSVRP